MVTNVPSVVISPPAFIVVVAVRLLTVTSNPVKSTGETVPPVLVMSLPAVIVVTEVSALPAIVPLAVIDDAVMGPVEVSAAVVTLVVAWSTATVMVSPTRTEGSKAGAGETDPPATIFPSARTF